jgi:hypothetical protein
MAGLKPSNLGWFNFFTATGFIVIVIVFTSSSGVIQTLDLRILSWLFHQCASTIEEHALDENAGKQLS